MFITPSLLLIGLAVLMAAMFIPAILSTKKWQKAMKKIVSDTTTLRLLSMILFIMSFLFLSVHWKFNGGWFIVIPIIGWLTLVKALTYLWFPEHIYKLAKKVYLKSENTASLLAFIGLLLSIGLTYVALYIY
jgi:hypothetical protein